MEKGIVIVKVVFEGGKSTGDSPGSIESRSIESTRKELVFMLDGGREEKGKEKEKKKVEEKGEEVKEKTTKKIEEVIVKVEKFFDEVIRYFERDQHFGWINILRKVVEVGIFVYWLKENKDKINFISFFSGLISAFLNVSYVYKHKHKNPRKIEKAGDEILYFFLKLKQEGILSEKQVNEIERLFISQYFPLKGVGEITGGMVISLFRKKIEELFDGGILINSADIPGIIRNLERPFAFLELCIKLGIISLKDINSDNILLEEIDTLVKMVIEYITKHILLHIKNPAPALLDQELKLLLKFLKYMKNLGKENDFVVLFLNEVKSVILKYEGDLMGKGEYYKYFKKNVGIFLEIAQALKDAASSSKTSSDITSETLQEVDKILLELFYGLEKVIKENIKDKHQATLRNKHLFDTVISAVELKIINQQKVSEFLRGIFDFNMKALAGLFSRFYKDPRAVEGIAMVSRDLNDMALSLFKVGIISSKELEEIMKEIHSFASYLSG